MEQEYIPGGLKVIVTAKGEQLEEVAGYYRSRVLIQVKSVPSIGYKTYVINEINGDVAIQATKNGESDIANELLKVRFYEGNISLKNKENNVEVSNFITFEDEADDGDSFDFSPLRDGEVVQPLEIRLLHVKKSSLSEKMFLEHQFVLPSNIKNRKGKINNETLSIFTTLELRNNETFVRVTHTIDNHIKDHRIRALLKTPILHPEKSYADQGYSLVKRSVTNPYLAEWRENGFVEAPMPIYPIEHSVSLYDQNQTFSVYTRGLKEYEVLSKSSEIALTLFRSNEFLGKDDLLWRPGRASGINNKVVYTPDAQMIQEMKFEYAIGLYEEKLNPQKIFNEIDIYQEHFLAYQKQTLNTFEGRLERFDIPKLNIPLSETDTILSIDNANIFMSTCKQGYSDDSVIARFFNPTEYEQSFTLTHKGNEAYLCSLAEENQVLIQKPIVVPSKGFVTVKIRNCNYGEAGEKNIEETTTFTKHK
ncbi:Mannosylglycerate hydrolase [compost metagenome]